MKTRPFRIHGPRPRGGPGRRDATADRNRPSGDRRNPCRLALLTLGPLLLLAVIAAGCGNTLVVVESSTTSLAPTSSDTSSSLPTTETAFTQQEGEIFLEPAGVAGPESFAGETFVPAGPTSTLDIPTSTTALPPPPSTVAGAGAQVASYAGDTPALYGGSKSKALVDKEGQLRFFEANPDKAAAFCAALNADSTFQWSGGTQIQPSQLRDYFGELTPVMLTRDTRVTNHGYRDGRPTPRQSVLQAGQMVLVDRWGVPRVRCECGNPLTPPAPVRTAPRYTGPRWQGFDPTIIIVVQQTTVIIQDFVLVDVYTGDVFVRPAGTEGDRDRAQEITVWRLDVEMLRNDARDERINSLSWTAEIALGPGGTFSVIGEGSFRSDGTTWKADASRSGTFTVEASFTLNLTGSVETTELGRILRIQPALRDYAIDSLRIDTTGDEARIRESVEAHVPEFIQDSLVQLDLKAEESGPLLASVASGGYEGSATLTPLR